MSAILKKKVVPEDAHQTALMQWARTVRLSDAPDVMPGSKVADYLYHIPNGGHRNAIVAAKLKAQGVKAGVSDLHLPLARHGFHGLWIELKAEGGRLRKSQAEWLDRMDKAGYLATVCVGWEAAARTIEDYVGGESNG